MIGTVQGNLKIKKPPLLLVEVQGIGYEIYASMNTFYHLPDAGHEVFLYTHLVVREDAHLLYGFYLEQERSLFRSLIKVSNVGPKLALAVLSGLEPDMFMRCVTEQDVHTLIKVPGVGKKTAERLIIEMRDRIADFSDQGLPTTSELPVNRLIQDAISALVSLGFKPHEASRAITQIKVEHTSTEQLIRHALQSTLRGEKNDNNGSIS